MEKIEAKVAALSTKTLKEMVVKLFNDSREGSEIVLSVVLSALEKRLPEAEFIEMCEAI
jgi:hypothetical protein